MESSVVFCSGIKRYTVAYVKINGTDLINLRSYRLTLGSAIVN